MKVLLDENITQKSIPVLQKYGHDVIHVLNRFSAGEGDEGIFRLALEEKRALITLNKWERPCDFNSAKDRIEIVLWIDLA